MRVHWQRQITADKPEHAGVNVILLELLEGRQVKLAAEGTLKVRKFDQREWRVSTTKRQGILNGNTDSVRRRRNLCHGRPRGGCYLTLQEASDLRQLVQNRSALLFGESLCLSTRRCSESNRTKWKCD